MIAQLICHLCGDYVIQNHWMANNKTKSSFAAAVHALSYTLPFLVLTRSPLALIVIAGTHFPIDRFRLARYWVEFWGVGCQGKVISWIRARKRAEWSANSLERVWDGEKFLIGGEAFDQLYPVIADAPPFLAVWLLIIGDNTMHLAINALALAYC